MQIDYSDIPDVFKISDEVIANLLLVDLCNEENKVPFVFDTGASITVMNETTANLFGAELTEDNIIGGGNSGDTIAANIFTLKCIKVGRTVLRDLEIAVVPDKALDFGTDDNGKDIDINGFLGWDIIQNFRWYYDSKSRRFRIEKSKQENTSVNANMEEWDNMPIIHANINGRNELFGFDTGNTESTIGDKLFPIFQGVKEIKDKFVGIGGVKEERVLKIDDVELKIGTELVNLRNISAINRSVFPTDNKDISGLLGIDIVQGRNWVLDYNNRIFEIKA